MKVILVVTLCLAAAKADTCPTLSVVQNFNVSKFAGMWHAQGVLVGNLLTQGYGTCVNSEFTLNSTSGVLDVLNSRRTREPEVIAMSYLSKFLAVETEGAREVRWNFINCIPGIAVLADSSKNEGNLKVLFKTAVGLETVVWSCLSTDYDSYAILFACYNRFGGVMRNGWLMTRTQVLKDDEKTTVEALITKALLTINAEGGPAYDDFHSISQTNC